MVTFPDIASAAMKVASVPRIRLLPCRSRCPRSRCPRSDFNVALCHPAPPHPSSRRSWGSIYSSGHILYIGNHTQSNGHSSPSDLFPQPTAHAAPPQRLRWGTLQYRYSQQCRPHGCVPVPAAHCVKSGLCYSNRLTSRKEHGNHVGKRRIILCPSELDSSAHKLNMCMGQNVIMIPSGIRLGWQ